jgi:hypothetical protein
MTAVNFNMKISSVAEPHHVDAAPALVKNFDAALTAPALTLLCRKPPFPKVSISIGTVYF